MASNVTDKSFEEEVLKSDLPVLVDFWAEWCGPCRMLTPIIEEVSKELENKVKVLKMNIVDDSETPSKLGIKSIPTLILFKDGEQLDIKVGIKQNNPKQEILDWIENNIKY
ncbi:thioredoxin [Rickettsia endosymbiont of Urophora cardui]|uniref:thioredoxin n=1 Tax=Rickettsia endosymbiont of Urophora cardui TaxID=3066265 RepID=UPI00313C611B